MTHQFSLVPALMIAALVSQTVSRKMNRENFYDAMLTQDGHQLEHVRPPRGLQGWQQLPVSAIANFRRVWPVIWTLQKSENSSRRTLTSAFPSSARESWRAS